MSAGGWNATVVDSPEHEPWAVVGDLVVAVRTPRSRDFITVEVAPKSLCDEALTRPAGVFPSPTPPPCFASQWRGEVHVGDSVGFRVAGESYRLTLIRLAENRPHTPWITCDLHLERD
jgi:hypothetical protein